MHRSAEDLSSAREAVRLLIVAHVHFVAIRLTVLASVVRAWLSLATHSFFACFAPRSVSPILGQATRQNTDMSESTDRLSPF